MRIGPAFKAAEPGVSLVKYPMKAMLIKILFRLQQKTDTVKMQHITKRMNIKYGKQIIRNSRV